MAKNGLYKWYAIRKHLTSNHSVFRDYTLATIITPNSTIYISKSNDKFRLKSYLDWAWYSPQTIAKAIDNDDLEVYYQVQLFNQNSDPNIWKRWNEEQDLKSYYAARANRASLI